MKLKQTFLAAAVSALAAAPAAAGELGSSSGKIFSGNNYMVVKKDLKPGGKIKRHNHSGFQTILFTAVEGRFKVVLNDKERYEVGTGETLKFDGEDYIAGEAADGGGAAAVITLIK